jgi:elongation factor G
MKSYKVEQIRNVSFVGHAGAGKTSVVEGLLFLSGVSDRLGKVGDNSSIMDYDPDEIRRGHSINASFAVSEWQKHKFNILDTPGNGNFIADTPGCIRVSDGAVIVIAADSGIQFYTEKVWQWADESSLKRIVFINKMDSEQASIQSILESLKKKFNAQPFLMHVPVGAADKFSGIVDLVENQYYTYEKDGKGLGTASSIPDEVKDEVEIRRAELVEAVAESDDELVESYLDKGELTDEEFDAGLKKGVESGQLVPVILGSGLHNIGTDRLAKAIIDFLPSPDHSPIQLAKALSGDEAVEVNSGNGMLASLVFKTIADPFAGKLTLFRVYSGSMKPDTSVFNANHEADERIGPLFTLQGKKQVSLPEIIAGDMGTVAKLKVTTTGDTLTTKSKGVQFDPIVFPNPVLARAMVPKTRADEEKISHSLIRLIEEDPSLKVERDAQTHELLVSGMGVEHLDVTIERLKRRFGVEVDMKPPKIPYRESICGKTKVQGKHKKQSGGHGQFGDAWLEISPMPRGGGFEFESRIVGGAIPKAYIPAVEKGVHEAMAQGVLAHFPIVDVKVSLVDGSYHDVDSSEMAFKIAGSIGFKKGVLECKPILLEPLMIMEVIVPSEFVGDVIGDLNSKRGKILGVDANDDNQSVRAHVPMASILNYAPELRALTSGRGVFVMEFDHYDVVPEHLTAKIIEESKKEAKEE